MKAKFFAPLVFIGVGLFLLLTMPAPAFSRPYSAPTACADLVPTLLLSNPSPQLNEAITIQLKVINRGDAAAGRFRAYLYVDPAEQPPTQTTADTTSFGTFGLNPQKEATFEYSDFTFTTTGNHRIYGWIDRDNQVAGECSESNNLLLLTVPIGVDPGCTPDSYENGSSDDLCATAPRMTTDGAIQRRNLCAPGDEDWVSFAGQAGVEYTIIAGNVEANADL